MKTATICLAGGCTRRTRTPHGFCWQHSDMAPPVDLDGYIEILSRIRDTVGGSIEVKVRGTRFEPPGNPKMIDVVDTRQGPKRFFGLGGKNKRRILCLN